MVPVGQVAHAGERAVGGVVAVELIPGAVFAFGVLVGVLEKRVRVAVELAQAEDDLRRQVIAAGGPAPATTSAVVSLDLAEVEAQIAEAVEAREQLDERIGRAQEERARLVHRLDELSTVEQLVELGVDLESIRAQRSDLARRAVVLALSAEVMETAGRRFEQNVEPA